MVSVFLYPLTGSPQLVAVALVGGRLPRAVVSPYDGQTYYWDSARNGYTAAAVPVATKLAGQPQKVREAADGDYPAPTAEQCPAEE